MDDASGLVPGAQLGKYRLEGLLGRGGMGEVWAAHDPDLDRRVALKVLRPSAAAIDDAQARLLREGRAMAKLRHPNVITVYEATTADGRDVIAMELIDGKSLAGWLAERRDPDAVVGALLAAGRGLAAAHAAGMIHRDFKPHNVLVDRDGRILVTDFGLARAIEPDGGAAAEAVTATARAELEDAATLAPSTAPRAPATGAALAETLASGPPARRTPARGVESSDRGALHSPLTRTGALLGTPAYMAPEQLAGRAADARSDQFAFCVTAWEALAGCRPFTGATLDQLRVAVDAGAPAGADKLPARLRAILARGLAHDPLQRWPSMDALLGALDRAWRRPRRAAIAAVAGVVIVAAVAVPIALVMRGSPAASACPSFAEDFAAARTDAARATLDRIGAAGAAGKRAAAYFDRWQASWRDARATTCARPRDPEFHARRACLASMRDKLVATLDLARDLPSAALAGADAVAVLPMPGVCVDRPLAIAPMTPPDPATLAEIRRIEAGLIVFRVVPARRPAETLPVLDPLLAAARRTGHDPLIAEALTIKGDALLPFDSAEACAAFDEAAVVAERAGADADRIEALLGQLECVQRLPERRHEIDGLIERARGLIDRLDDGPHRASLDMMRAELRGSAGAWDEAIDIAGAARATWHALDAPIGGGRAAVLEARFRMARATGDDLQRAEQVLRDSLDEVPAEAEREVMRIRRTLGEVLWIRGRLDEAVGILVKFQLREPAGDVDVHVRVVDHEGAPADGAELLAALDPVGDPIRLVRTELRAAVTARADAHGEATMRVPAGSVIVARKHDEIAAIEAPAASGDVHIALVPAAYVQVRVTRGTGPAPAEPGEGRWAPLLGAVSMRVGARRWSLVSPVDARGVFRLPALPGRVAISVETGTAHGDAPAAMAIVQLRPGGQTAELTLARPVSLRVIARPAFEGLVLALPGAHAAATWTAVAAVREAGGPFTLAAAPPPLTAAAGDARPGDTVAELGAPGPGPITVCALPGASSPDYTPVASIDPGPDATPPACVTATAVDGTVTTVVIPTAR